MGNVNKHKHITKTHKLHYTYASMWIFAELLQKIYFTIVNLLDSIAHDRDKCRKPLHRSHTVWLFSAEKLQNCFSWRPRIVFDDPEKLLARDRLLKTENFIRENSYDSIRLREISFRIVLHNAQPYSINIHTYVIHFFIL